MHADFYGCMHVCISSHNTGHSHRVHCIVLYLSIYKVLLAVHTNQKRFLCERPIEKKAVFREREEALDSSVNKEERVEGGSWIQSAGPIIEKARV